MEKKKFSFQNNWTDVLGKSFLKITKKYNKKKEILSHYIKLIKLIMSLHHDGMKSCHCSLTSFFILLATALPLTLRPGIVREMCACLNRWLYWR